jgi:hypothetical protein
MNLTEKLNQYLHDWYTSLPIPAINSIHQLTPDYLYQFNNDEFEDIMDELRDDWYQWELETKLDMHDQIFEQYQEFTKNISITL